MAIISWFVLVIGTTFLLFAVYEFVSYLKGWGIKYNDSNDPFFTSVKPCKQKIQRITLALYGVVFMISGLILVWIAIYYPHYLKI
jgi:hypothetical protein